MFNPVLDAERHSYRQEQRARKREFLECDCCHGKIYRADDEHYGDDYYEINDQVICEDCIMDYLREIRKEYA